MAHWDFLDESTDYLFRTGMYFASALKNQHKSSHYAVEEFCNELELTSEHTEIVNKYFTGLCASNSVEPEIAPEKSLCLTAYLCAYHAAAGIGLEKIRSLLTATLQKNGLQSFYQRHLFSIEEDLAASGSSGGFLKRYLNPDDSISDAIEWSSKLVACDTIDMKDYPDLTREMFQHPGDVEWMNKVRAIPGFEKLSKKYNELFIDRARKFGTLASSVRYGKKQMAEEYALFVDTCRRLGIKEIPEMYSTVGFINAFTQGMTSVSIIVTSTVPLLLSKAERQFIYGHELGHVICKHQQFKEMFTALPYIGQSAAAVTLGISMLVTSGLEMALSEWYRRGEFSADRVGYLACNDFKAAATTIIKLSGVPFNYMNEISIDDFMAQADEYLAASKETIDKMNKGLLYLEKDISHPFSAIRLKELKNWVDAGAPLCKSDLSAEIPFQPTQPPRAIQSNEQFCPQCRAVVKKSDGFCYNCGHDMR